MQMIHDALSAERIQEFLKAETKGPTAEQKAELMDAELRAKRDRVDEAIERREAQLRKVKALAR